MSVARFVPHSDRFDPGVPAEEAARGFFESMKLRRTVRAFSDRPVSRETIEWLVRTAGSAPSGANKQPWRFVCVQDPELKKEIRRAAEVEEREFYARRASAKWLEDLAPLGTDDVKSYMEVAPWLVVIFRMSKTDDGGQVYYPQESVGIAVGMFLASAHQAGLATLVHTPSPMRFLQELLGRPRYEWPFAVIPVGYPADDCEVPVEALSRRPLDEVMVVDRGS